MLIITNGCYEEGKQWEKIELIGSGTSANVYKARDTSSDVVFAVKEYKKVQVTLSLLQIYLT